MVSCGLLGNAVGMLILSQAGVDTGYTLVAVALAVIGLSIALAMIPALDAILGAIPAGETGAGSALTRAIQNVGASFGVAVMGSILNSAYQARVGSQVAGLPARVQAAVQTSVAVAAAVAQHLPAPIGARVLRVADEAYSEGMAEVLLVTAGLTVAGAVLIALLLPARDTNAIGELEKEAAGTPAADIA
jgi:hypothetical protein